MIHIKQTFNKVYKKITYITLTISIFVLFTLLNYILLTRVTAWELFMQNNTQTFIAWSLFLTTVNNILIAIAFTLLIYVIESAQKFSSQFTLSSLISTVFNLISVGCTICGSFLLPLLGIAVSLSAFPFYGLEIKISSIILLIVTISNMSMRVSGRFDNSRKISIFREFGLLYLSIIFIGLVYVVPRLPFFLKQKINWNTRATAIKTTTKTDSTVDKLFDEINPQSGYEINATYGNLGPRMVKSGVIDLENFKKIYENSGRALTQEQLDILTNGSNKKIKITRENSYFLLNFFWAAGLANRSKALTEGDIQKYGQGQVNGFASTGGWTLAKGDPMNYYASLDLIPMTDQQESLVDKVSSNIYRPCCDNPTSFPDCNHGMALLAVLQLMASQGANENQLYEGAKYFNAFFFPSNYYDLALYFQNKEGKSFKEVDGRTLLSKEFSSASGWQVAKRWLTDKGIVKQPPKQGGGCGV